MADQVEKKESIIYDEIPEEKMRFINDDFVRTFLLAKKSKPKTKPSEIFLPFENIKKSLKDFYGIDVMDENANYIYDDLRFKEVEEVFQKCSERDRQTKKSPEALAHDAFHYLFVLGKRKTSEKEWFITLDKSCYSAGIMLAEDKENPFCLTLAIFLQSVSPFIENVDERINIGSIIINMIKSAFVPRKQIYEIDDFLLLHEMGMQCKEMPEAELDECISFIKAKHRLGKVHSQTDREEIAYELRKHFTYKQDALKRMVKEKEEEICRLKDDLNSKSEIIKSQSVKLENAADDMKLLAEYETRNRRSRKRWNTAKTIVLIGFIIIITTATILSLNHISVENGIGVNRWQKILSFWPLYVAAVPVDIVLIYILAKILWRKKSDFQKVKANIQEFMP